MCITLYFKIISKMTNHHSIIFLLSLYLSTTLAFYGEDSGVYQFTGQDDFNQWVTDTKSFWLVEFYGKHFSLNS